MYFPFEYTFKKKLVGEIEKFSTTEILCFYKNYYKKLGADSVKLLDDHIIINNYWTALIPRPLNSWSLIVSATYQIIENDNHNRIAVFRINMLLVWISGAVFGICTGVSFQLFWVGLIVFLITGVLGCAIKLFEHKIDFEDFILEKKYNLSKNNLNNI
jgi:hypothetical protein